MTPVEKHRVCMAYRTVFFGDGGAPTPAAEVILRDLEKVCGWMVEQMPVSSDGRVDPLKLAGAFEKRRVFAHIKKRLFEPLDQVSEKEPR